MAVIPGKLKDEVVILGNHNDGESFPSGEWIFLSNLIHPSPQPGHSEQAIPTLVQPPCTKSSKPSESFSK